MMQKAEQIKIAQECGVRIAEFEIVKVGQLPTKVKYPLITKAVNSLVDGWKKNVLSVIMKQNLEMPISIWMKVKSCYRNTFIKKMNCVLMALR